MAAQTWPASLPDFVLQSGYSERPPDLTVRTQMDVGDAKSRRRATAAPTPIDCQVQLTRAQTATLDTFYDSTLKGGTLPFDWVHPRTQNAVEMKFRERPTYRPNGPSTYIAQLPIKVLP